MKNVIISLFDLTGNWSKFYKENGYEVIQVDIQKGINILEWDYTTIDKEKVYGILASVPCTDFAVSGARWFKEKDENGQTEKSNKLVRKTKEIIDYFNPTFWVIENPISRIHKIHKWMGQPKMYFHPYEYAGYGYNDETYTKKTALWGNFNIPTPKELPINKKDGHTRIHYPKRKDGTPVAWGSLECKNIRSATPLGFAKAFYLFNSHQGGHNHVK